MDEPTSSTAHILSDIFNLPGVCWNAAQQTGDTLGASWSMWKRTSCHSWQVSPPGQVSQGICWEMGVPEAVLGSDHD